MLTGGSSQISRRWTWFSGDVVEWKVSFLIPAYPRCNFLTVTEEHVFPIIHTVVMHQTMAWEKPWVAQRLVTAFREAQRLTDDYYAAGPKRLSLPGAALIVEEEMRDYGAEPWSHRIAGNEHNVETFVRYARDQGYIDRIIPLEEFFVESAMDI